MKNILSSFSAKPLALYLALALIILSPLAHTAEAMHLPVLPQNPGIERTADLVMIQKTLELKTVQQRLLDYGLTPEETMTKLAGLPDDQLHQLARNMDSLQAGGDILGTLFALALIGLIVLLIIFILEGRIEIQHR